MVTEVWPSRKPQNGLLNDMALLALIVPGILLAHFILIAEDAPLAARLLLASLDLFIVALIVLLALFLDLRAWRVVQRLPSRRHPGRANRVFR